MITVKEAPLFFNAQHIIKTLNFKTDLATKFTNPQKIYK